MSTFQKIGGGAAFTMAAGYILGIAVFLVFLDASGYEGSVGQVAFLVETKLTYFWAMLASYIIPGIALLILTLAFHERLRSAAPILMQIATVIGLIWSAIVIASALIFISGMDVVTNLYAQDPERSATVWIAVATVHDALGGGSELLGGIWMLLVSWAALRAGWLAKPLNYFGIIIALAGIFSIIPMLEILTAVFGLSQIIWFLLIGYKMFFGKQPDQNLNVPQ